MGYVTSYPRCAPAHLGYSFVLLGKGRMSPVEIPWVDGRPIRALSLLWAAGVVGVVAPCLRYSGNGELGRATLLGAGAGAQMAESETGVYFVLDKWLGLCDIPKCSSQFRPDGYGRAARIGPEVL